MDSTAAGQSRCLDAFTIAVQQACEGFGWYASTKQLQLASFQYCVACRNETTLHLVVDDCIPRRLLAAAAAEGSRDQPLALAERGLTRAAKRGSRRVPRFNARKVTWSCKSSRKLATPMNILSDAEDFLLERGLEGDLGAVAWPPRLKRFAFGDLFDEEVDGIAWPSSLEVIDFGFHFNQPIEAVKWPAQLLEVRLSEGFDHEIEQVAWPPTIECLSFGYDFDRSIERVAWPVSLRQLVFGHRFNHPIERVSWPASLRWLKFGKRFNQPVGAVTWPAELQQLEFGDAFSQKIDEVLWPLSLQQLSLGRWFNEPLCGVGKCMPGLLELTLRMRWQTYSFSIGTVEWPPMLQKLTIDKRLWDHNWQCFPKGLELDVFLH